MLKSRYDLLPSRLVCMLARGWSQKAMHRWPMVHGSRSTCHVRSALVETGRGEAHARKAYEASNLINLDVRQCADVTVAA